MAFAEGATTLGTVPVDSTGKAVLETALTGGTHTIVATFTGSPDFHPSTSSAITETIIEVISTQTALAASPNPARAKSPVVLRATVQTGASLPQGIVTFMDGSSALGTANVESDGTASLTVASLAPGTHSLIATYAGSDAFTASTSAPVSERVNEASSPAPCVPVIVTPPADSQLSPDGTATVSVATDSDPLQTFEWYLGSYPDVSRPIGSSASLTITNLWASTDVWVLVTNNCGTAHASAHLAAPAPSRRRSVRK